MTTEPRPPTARAFSCLVKGPLGCLAFLVGAAIVLVLFFPPVGGRLLDRWAEAGFAERFEGRLELGDAWVGSLYGRQRVERVVLRDPGGEEVLSGRLTAPSLEGVLDGAGGSYGPIRLSVDLLRLVLDADGSTNLDRALTVRPGGRRLDGRNNLRTDVPFEVELVVEIARARVEDPGGATETLTDLVLTGRLEWTPDQLRVRLEGGSSAEQWAAFRVECDLWWSLVREGRWAATWTLHDAPSALAAIGLRPLGQLADLAGARVDRVEGRREDAAVEARVLDEGRDLTLRGHYRVDPPALVGEGLQERIELAVDARHLGVLAPLLPLATGLQAEGARLELGSYAWGLADVGDVSGLLRLELQASGYELAPGLPAIPESERLVPAAGSLDRDLVVDHGALVFDRVSLPLEGGQLVLVGSVDLVSGERELAARLESGETSLELGPLLPAAAGPPPIAPRAPQVQR